MQPTPAKDAPLPYRGALLLLAFMQVTHVIEFMLMMPLGPELMRLFQITPTQFSLLVASYTFAAGVSGLVVASVADRFDRKSLLLFMYGGMTLATLACAFAKSFEVLVFARILAGVFGGVLTSTTYAIVGDLVPVSHRGRATGIIGVAFPISSTLGVPLSLFIAQRLGWNAPFTILAILCALLLVLAWRVLPSVRAHVSHASNTTGAHPLRVLWAAVVARDHRAAFALTGVITFSSFLVIPFISPVMIRNGLMPESALPMAYAIGGLSALICVPFIGRWADASGKRFVFTVLNMAAMIAIFVVTHATAAGPLWWVFAQWALFMVATSGRWTPALALITGAPNANQRGSFLAVNSSVMQFASSAGTFIAGLILVQNANGSIGRYEWVGFLAIVVATGAFWIVRRVKANS